MIGVGLQPDRVRALSSHPPVVASRNAVIVPSRRATGSTALPSSCSPRNGTSRHWRSPRRPRSASPRSRRSTRRRAPTRPSRCTTSAGTRTRWRSPPRRSRRPGAGARPRSWRTRCGSSAPSSTPRASSICGKPWRSQRSPARLEHAKALAALGVALRAARRPSEARDPLRRALELADTLGAEAVARRARQELYATGARPRSTALRGPDALTPSERRIAERAAGGETNRAIGEALYVTPRTVELHLSNAYRKLGARGRHDLAALLEHDAAPA